MKDAFFLSILAAVNAFGAISLLNDDKAAFAGFCAIAAIYCGVIAIVCAVQALRMR